jgi:transcriptional regulator with XRE-family HTH domain
MTKISNHERLEDDREIEAIEGFMVDVQVYLNEIMEKKKISRAELARRMGVSRARVSQMFSDDSNVTVRQLARAAYHLGEEPRVESETTRSLRDERTVRRQEVAVHAASNVHWIDVSANNIVDSACSDDDDRIHGILARAGAR